ncbi:PREDICTED: uncharacterized protein LOC107086957 isoform X1 [Cyprinodon variegatus]|uniref:uncharacterized protein LOC107086957 isoform X1 n=2 Tax=Cyprinodon variegatus TaxID=28743 RepID=UPI000742605A|nr:PREDICTED: uncharacterized protein LOC107086957 isoform X1 [Cyprinodon variegatus]
MATKTEVAQLEDRMNVQDYRKLQSLFLDSCSESRSLSRNEFIDLAWMAVGRGSREEYGLLFDSAVASQEPRKLLESDGVKECGCVSWRGLSSFLLLKLSDKLHNSRAICAPCWKPTLTLTCPHRGPVQKVLYIQSSGQYLTVSKAGTVVLRDKGDMSIQQKHRLQNNTVTPRDLWVTDMVLLPSMHKIAVSFTCKEVCFYDIQDFSCKYKLKGLTFAPWCLDFWMGSSHSDQAVLTIGDIGGKVSALNFTFAQICLFDSLCVRMDSDSGAPTVLWDELVKGKHCCCYVEMHQAHSPAWVRKVRFLASLEAFLSCSTRPDSSMVIGWREKDGRGLRVSSFATKSGVLDVNYNSGLGLIATAGVDHNVLLWNPYVTSKPVCALIGHSSPVTTVQFMQTKGQLITYSKDKVLCFWEVSSQVCVRRLAGVFPKTQKDPHTILSLQEELNQLLLTFNSQLLLLETIEDGRTSNNQHPVT